MKHLTLALAVALTGCANATEPPPPRFEVCECDPDTERFCCWDCSIPECPDDNAPGYNHVTGRLFCGGSLDSACPGEFPPRTKGRR